MRLGIAEIGQHAVAHEFGDVTVEPGDRPGAGVLVALDQTAQVFGVKRTGKCRRADQIAEQNGDLAALGLW